MMERVINLSHVFVYHDRKVGKNLLNKGRILCPGDLVLSDVNIEIKEGELVYLIGRVGSGKSTLLKALYAEIPITEGDADVVGFNLKNIKDKYIPVLRRKIGIVFQDYQLLTDRNVFHNLQYVMHATGWENRHEIYDRIKQVLSIVGLANKDHKMPFELSGGEQQRLSIARALVNSPKLIIADEPTGNLDPKATDEVMAIFKEIVQSGCAVVMSTHNVGVIQRYPSRTLRFSAGKVEQIDIESILGI